MYVYACACYEDILEGGVELLVYAFLNLALVSFKLHAQVPTEQKAR
jgi:hypothetical protein